MDDRIKKKFITYLTGNKATKLTTAKRYIQNIEVFEKKSNINLDKVTHENVVNYLSEMNLKYNRNANTRRLMKTALETFYKWYSPIIGLANPTLNLEKIKKYRSHPKLIHPDEVERMLYQLDLIGSDWSRRACAVVAFLADTGIRIEEFESMKAGNVRLIKKNSEKAYFEVIVPGLKNNYERRIPFANLLDGGIGEYFARYYTWLIIEKGQRPNQPLFFQIYNKQCRIDEDLTRSLRRSGVHYLLKKGAYLAGIDRGITPHQFRHFYGTYSIINGMSIFALKEFMGHANIQTTYSYVHLAEKVSGNIFQHSPTKKVKVPKYMIGYSKVVRDMANYTG